MSNKQKARNFSEDKVKNALTSFEPVRINTDVEAKDVETVTLFVIDDKEYKIKKDISPSYGLRYLRTIVANGAEIALYTIMIELLGEDGYNALADCPHVTKEHFEGITKLIQQLVLGSLDTKN